MSVKDRSTHKIKEEQMVFSDEIIFVDDETLTEEEWEAMMREQTEK